MNTGVRLYSRREIDMYSLGDILFSAHSHGVSDKEANKIFTVGEDVALQAAR